MLKKINNNSVLSFHLEYKWQWVRSLSVGKAVTSKSLIWPPGLIFDTPGVNDLFSNIFFLLLQESHLYCLLEKIYTEFYFNKDG